MKTTLLCVLVMFFSSTAFGQSVEKVIETPADATKAPVAAAASFKLAIADFVAGTPFEGVSGVIDVKMSGSAPKNDIITVLDVTCDSIRVGNFPVGTLKGTWRRSKISTQSRLQLMIEGVLGSAQLVLEADLDLDLVAKTVTLRPGPIRGALTMRLADITAITATLGKALSGRVLLDLSMSGVAESPEFSARFHLEDAALNGQKIGDLQVDWVHAKESQIGWRWMNAGRAVIDVSATLPLSFDAVARDITLRRQDPLSFTGKVLGLDSSLLKPFVRLPRGLELGLSGDVKATGTLDALTGSGQIEGVAVAGGVSAPLAIWFSTVKQEHQIDANWGEFLNGQVKSKFSLRNFLDDPEAIPRATWKGNLQAAMPTGALAAVFPSIHDANGVVKGEVKWGGIIDAPTWEGELSTAKASFTHVDLHRRIKDAKGTMKFSGQEAEWTVVGAAMPGKFEAKGTASFSPTGAETGEGLWGRWKAGAEAELTLKRFPFVQRDFPFGLVDADLKMTGEWTHSGAKVAVDVGKSRIDLIDEQLPKTKSIPFNNDIEFVDLDVDATKAGGKNLELSVTVDSVRLVGQGTDIKVGGTVHVHRQDDIVRVKGGLDTERGGVFSLFDNPFKITKGRVTLAEGNLRRAARLGEDGAPEPSAMEPVIALAAQSEVEGTYVLVRLDGAVQRPTLTLASLPAVPEYQIMTLLVTGRVDAVDDKNGNVRKAVAKLVERYHNPSLQRQLFDRLGVDKVGLGFASSITNPILTVGKQLTKTLYVETIYRHGAPAGVNMMEGHIEKRIARHWTVDTTFGEAAEGRVGVFWWAKFGGPPTKEPAPDEWDRLAPPDYSDDDDDGIANLFDLCPTEPEDIDGFQDSDGCPDPDNDGDGVADVQDKEPNVRETFNGSLDNDGAPDDAPARLVDLQSRMKPILFARNATRLSREELQVIEALGEVIRRLGPDVRILVVGHSDGKGSPQTKFRVSRERAQTVRRALIKAGVSAKQVGAEGRGDAELVDPADTPEAAALNRRAVLELSLPPAQTTDPAAMPSP